MKHTLIDPSPVSYTHLDVYKRQARNLPGVKTALTSTINVYDILKYDTVVVSKEAVANIEEVYA